MRSSISKMGTGNEASCSKNSAASQDVEAVFSDVMSGAQYMYVHPMFYVLYKVIRETSNSYVLCLVSILTGEGLSRLGPAKGTSAWGTGTAMRMELGDSKLHFVFSRFVGKGLSETSIQTKLCTSTKWYGTVDGNIRHKSILVFFMKTHE